MAQTPEGKIKGMVKKALVDLQASAWRFMPVQTGYGADALDFICCIDGFFIAIETKANASAKMTPRQIATAAQIVNAGGRVFRVHDQTTLDCMVANIRLLMEFNSASSRNEPRPRGHGILVGSSSVPPQGAES